MLPRQQLLKLREVSAKMIIREVLRCSLCHHWVKAEHNSDERVAHLHSCRRWALWGSHPLHLWCPLQRHVFMNPEVQFGKYQSCIICELCCYFVMPQ